MVSEEILDRAEDLNTSAAMVSAPCTKREENKPKRLIDKDPGNPGEVEKVYDSLGLSTDSIHLYIHDLKGDREIVKFKKDGSDELVEALDLLVRGRDIYQAKSTYSTSSNMAVDKLRPYLDEDSREGELEEDYREGIEVAARVLSGEKEI